jgi:hypothetical protein
MSLGSGSFASRWQSRCLSCLRQSHELQSRHQSGGNGAAMRTVRAQRNSLRLKVLQQNIADIKAMLEHVRQSLIIVEQRLEEIVRDNQEIS